MTDAHEGTRGNEATMWTDEAMHAAYKEAFDKDPDAHHWALLSWIRDDMQQALAAEHAAALARIEELTASNSGWIDAFDKAQARIAELEARCVELVDEAWQMRRKE